MNAFAKYFFTHDQLNYVQHTPLYIADMLSLRENDVKTWDYLKDNFSVSKSQISFTSIVSDHAIGRSNPKQFEIGRFYFFFNLYLSVRSI